MNERIHFAGVAGSGMSALAQLLAWDGVAVSGSDRSFDQGGSRAARTALAAAGIGLFPQDGSGVPGAGRVVASAAVESEVPDLLRARELGIPIQPRGELLAAWENGKRSLAVAGTNGKSTTAALLAWILMKNGFDPGVALGASVRNGFPGLGNARRGGTDWFCFEADESDGGLERYRPYLGVVTNISLDHFDLERLAEIFSRFAGNCRRGLVRNADCPISRRMLPFRSGETTFSLAAPSDFRAEAVALGPDGLRFRLRGVDFALPLRGAHNAENALAASAAAASLGIELPAIAAALADFPGLRRRLETVFDTGSIAVIDDYAHNPAKARAALASARLKGKRVIALYQPHGFGPLRLARDELAEVFARSLSPSDLLYLLPVYYAGGTVRSGIGSPDLAGAVRERGGSARMIDRDEVVPLLSAEAKAGDVILVMGGRDESLSDLAREIAEAIKEKGK